jgi:hypothetical protein
MRSKGYDLVLNGVELGSGSIRIHQQELQDRVFKMLGLSEEQRRARFGFFLDALTYGTPPHGGIALGLDRVVALLAGEKSIREVIAFPKTSAAQDLMAEAPSDVPDDQLWDLSIVSVPPAFEFKCKCQGQWRIWAESVGQGKIIRVTCPDTREAFDLPQPIWGKWRALHRNANTGFAVKIVEN